MKRHHVCIQITRNNKFSFTFGTLIGLHSFMNRQNMTLTRLCSTILTIIFKERKFAEQYLQLYSYLQANSFIKINLELNSLFSDNKLPVWIGIIMFKFWWWYKIHWDFINFLFFGQIYFCFRGQINFRFFHFWAIENTQPITDFLLIYGL